ncbi:MAG: prenyltransferase/squalene oxidase repeat-containing protein [Prosthecobacter sp.]|uniref:prenyltransferase/squalene oxidase repeat-containing protein n=1 Tax=Prosthecobacter sp. TaxID=1965333 RepID=UPI0039010B98
METAVQRGLALVTTAASNWPKHKTCFSCHHQTLPMLSVIENSRAGHSIDPVWLKTQSDITHAYFEERIDDMLAGDHVPGGATTVGYGFWVLQMTAQPADDTTTAMVAYLLKIQGVARLKGREPAKLERTENGRWTTSCRRPPLQGSDVADTVLSLLGMTKYASAEQQPAFAKAKAAALKWLAQAKLERQEDHIWRLWGLHHLGGDEAAKQTARDAIIKAQQPDGGWSQAADLPSDAFSTGQTLFMLLKTGIAPDHPAIQQARDHLLRTQHADGSWLVESRVKNKVQPYFENGDPHGEHQFLSTAATAWAVAGLAQLLPSKP